jgi:membrane protease YdiL (CAAX protease family)
MTDPSPGIPALIWLFVLLVGVPVASAPRIPDPESIRRTHLYVAAAASLWVLALLTVGVSIWEGMGADRLFLRPPGAAGFLLWSGGLLGAGVLLLVALLAIQARLGHREPALVAHIMPRTAREGDLFLVLSFSAGACEEWIFRGFALAVLHDLTGSLWIAAVVQAAAFGAAHAYQSAWGLVRASLLGTLLALPAVLAGSIWPAVVAHFLLDVLAGLVIWPRFEKRLSPPPGADPQ